MKKVVGLTGGIASGKSTVSSLLKDLGVVIIDADDIARSIVRVGSDALKEIRAYFGQEYFFSNGELNRKKLGEHVFNQEEALDKLNEITHPRIIEKIKNEINWHKQNSPNPVIIVDAALLIEMGLVDLVDEVWLVAVPYGTQLKRLMERENLTVEGAENRISSQMSLEEKKHFADKIIDNSGDVVALEEQVRKIWQDMTRE